MTTKASLRVLVVDDDKSVRDALTKVLIQRGYSVSAATSGDEAIRQLQAARFGLMLLDVRMPPGPSGLEVIPQALDLDPQLPIIMLTAVADLTTAARCMQLGARDFLTKPVDLQALSGAIDKSIGA